MDLTKRKGFEGDGKRDLGNLIERDSQSLGFYAELERDLKEKIKKIGFN